jgi:hypothetical protein
MRLLPHLFAATAFGLSLLILSHVAAQSRTGDQVQQALAEQDAWLSGQQSAVGWNRYLQTPNLKAQLQKGPSADRDVVRTILGKYQAHEPGLRLPEFASTRKALSDWLSALSQPKLSDLSALVRQAKSDFKPAAKADVLSRQVKLEAAVRRLDRYLKNSGANGEGWRKYLKLDDLQAELKKDLNADPKTLDALAAHYISGATGLELPQFAGVANALQPYADLLAAYQNSEAKSANDKDLDALADMLDAAAKKPAEIDRRQLGALLNRIAASGQAPALVAAVRGELAQPNLLVHVSKPIVAGGIDDQVNEETPVKDVILGTDVVGKGHTTGQVTTALLPNRDHAVVQITLNGQTKAKTVGYHGMVTVFSHGTTSLAGTKTVNLDANAFTGDPASAECCTTNNIDCIDVCAGPLITRMATKRVYASKGEAEAIAGDHAESRLEGRMDTRAATLLDNANRSFNERFRNPLTRRGAFPQELSFSTTSDWLNVVGLQARSNELGATVPPPDAAASTQLSIRVHESLVDNMNAAVMPGKTIRSLAYRRSVRDGAGMRYEPAEFNDYLLSMGEIAAPAEHRDNSLVVPFDQFQSLMKDRNQLNVTQAEYDALSRALYNATLTQQQFDRYLAGLSRETVSYEQVMKFLADAKRGDVQVNYSAMTFADERPIEIQFHDNTAHLVLRMKSTTQPNLGNDGKQVVNPYPAEISVTYRLTLDGGVAKATRVQGEYGIKPIPLPADAESNLSLREKTRRSTLLTKTLPRRFFGEGEASSEDSEAGTEPIFPAQLKSQGLTLRGRWQRLGELPWTQLIAQDGWLALGWTLPQHPGTTETTAMTNEDLH